MEAYQRSPLVLRLADLLNIDEPADFNLELLPLCHTTKLEALRKMLSQKKIVAVETYEEFQNESLLFFFYGKARYIPQSDVKTIFDMTNPPIAFVFNIDTLPNPTRMLPFDSGGYHLYDIKIPLQEFVIKTDSFEDIKKFIKQVYSENQNYINKEITINPNHYPLCTPLRHLKSLYDQRVTTPTRFGEQAYTMEIQYKNDLPLQPYAIVLPDYMVSSQSGIDQLTKAFASDTCSIPAIHTYKTNKEIVFIYNDIIDIVNDIVTKMVSNNENQ